MIKKELINIAQSMDNDMRYTGFYSFAVTFFQNPNIPANKKPEKFLSLVKRVSEKSADRGVQSILGKRNAKDKGAAANDILSWCRAILNNSYLKELSTGEMHYVMGVCAHLSRIAKENI